MTDPKLLLMDLFFVCFWIWFYVVDGRHEEPLLSKTVIAIIAISSFVSVIQLAAICKKRIESTKDL
jgi:hypothetical protein